MTEQTQTQANTDAPVASVPVGISEIVSYLTAIAALLNGYLGHDYGLGRNAQAISLLVAGLVVLGSSVSRAIKHHGAMKANALTYASQAAQLGAQLVGEPITLNTLTTAVGTLSSDVDADSGYTPKHAGLSVPDPSG